MVERKVKTVSDIAVLLVGTDQADLSFQGTKDDIYAWVERTLNRHRYGKLYMIQQGRMSYKPCNNLSDSFMDWKILCCPPTAK